MIVIPSNVKSVASSINKFAIDLYDKMSRTDGNVFLSPYSVGVALAMTYAGARGDTEKEMAEVLHFELDKWQIHTTFGKLIGFLQTDDEQIKVANALWVQQNYKLLDSFIDTIESNYGKSLFEVDFAESEVTRKQINNWVKEKTRDKIEEILQLGMITPITRLVLTNAIHFKSDWSSKFKEKDTNDTPFKLLNGQEVLVPMMYQKAQFGYLETDQFQALELPYEGSDYSLVVFLPRKDNDLPTFEKMLREEKVEQWLSRIKYQRVKVYLPKFTLKAAFDLAKTLQELGMITAFSSGKADFFRITENPELCISAVLHKTFLNVDEKGTEAAAATAVVMLLKEEPMETDEPIFRADHPFMFLIRHSKTGTILFIGRLVNP